MIVAVDCVLEEVDYQSVAASEVEQRLETDASVEALVIAGPTFVGAAMPDLLGALDRRPVPVLALLDELSQLKFVPTWVDDFAIAPVSAHELKARLARAAQRHARQSDERRKTEVLSAMGSMVGGVAHDVRNRLFGISATIDAFQSHTRNQPDLLPFFEVLHAELSKLGRHLTDLVDYGRASLLQSAPAQLRDAISEAVILAKDLAASSGVTVDAQLPSSLPLLLFDQRRIVQLFHNLLINSIHQAPNGRIALEISFERGAERLLVTARLRDDGRGLPAGELETLFDPRFSRRAGGIGLGLAIARRIAEAHGGAVRADQSPSGGTVITVQLSLAEAGVATQRARPAST